MTDLDARVAALEMALQYISWHAFGECRVGHGPIPEAIDVADAIRAELQKPALYEPVTDEEVGEALLRYYAPGAPDLALASMRAAINHVLQGRAKPEAGSEQKTFVKRVGDGFKQQSDGTWAKPAQEEITDAEPIAKAIYEQWVDRPGYVQWETHGNSIMQDKARDIARAAICASKGEKTSYPSFAEMFQPSINTPIKFTTTQSIQRDAELHGIPGYFDGTKYWSKDGADHWAIHEITNWKAIKS